MGKGVTQKSSSHDSRTSSLRSQRATHHKHQVEGHLAGGSPEKNTQQTKTTYHKLSKACFREDIRKITISAGSVLPISSMLGRRQDLDNRFAALPHGVTAINGFSPGARAAPPSDWETCSGPWGKWKAPPPKNKKSQGDGWGPPPAMG